MYFVCFVTRIVLKDEDKKQKIELDDRDENNYTLKNEWQNASNCFLHENEVGLTDIEAEKKPVVKLIVTFRITFYAYF